MNNLIFDKARQFDFIALGRACVDLNANEIHRPMEETITFTKYLGGSPANIAVAVSKLGLRTGFIGKVSNDQHGKFIKNYFEKVNVDTSNLVFDPLESMTGLAFTEIKSPTDCSILMYRDNVADLNLGIEDINENYIKNAKVLLISGTALAASPSREATFLALEFARKNGTLIFFDLDYRPYTWKSESETSIYYNLAAEKCDVIIGTREEFDMMEELTHKGNEDDYVTAKKWFDYNAKIVVIKHGKEGSISYTKEGKQYKGEIYPAKVVKTFGAGDSYAGAFIYGLMKNLDIDQCMSYGSASASMVISSHSCSDAMPSIDELNTFIGKCESGEILKDGWE